MASSVNALTSQTASPTGSSAATDPSTGAGANQQISEGTFLQLLVAQLQNQDPMQPMDGMQFVTQLAQFSQLESIYGIQNNTNTLVADAGGSSSTGTSTGTGATTPATGN